MDPLDIRANEGATSDYESDHNPSDFTSVYASSMHVYEHGRRYQSFLEGRYPLPNDETEQDREAMKHFLFSAVLGDRLFLSPIAEPPHKIADMGCGAGLWTIDVADKYQSARVIGVDLSNIQPRWVPQNAEFRMDDIEMDWSSLYSDLDLGCFRSVVQTLRNPNRVIDMAFQNIKPGGWIEFQDLHQLPPDEPGAIPPGHPVSRFLKLLNETFGETWGWDVYAAARVPDYLRRAGFNPVHTHRVALQYAGPPCATGKEREWGLMARSAMSDLYAAMLMAKYNILGLSRQEADSLHQEILAAMSSRTEPLLIYLVTTWAQKPL